MANIQEYGYSVTNPASVPSHADMLAQYNRRNEWLGQFRHPDFASRLYKIDGNIEVADLAGTSFNVADLLSGGSLNEVHLIMDESATADTEVSFGDDPLENPYELTQFNYMYVELETGGQIYNGVLRAHELADLRLAGTVRVEFTANGITVNTSGTLNVYGLEFE